MGRPIRHLPFPESTFEVTTRCIHGRLLLRPSAELNEIILGILGRALVQYPVKLHAVTVASNHMHMILTVSDSRALAGFMCCVNSKIAREAGRLHDWREKLWGRRYRAIPILDDESIEKRLRYVLAHGCKEGLVRRPGDWPGVNCVAALTEGVRMKGVWFDRTAEFEARRKKQAFGRYEFSTEYELKLAPLPCWAEFSEDERRKRAQAMIEVIEQETREQLEREGRGVMGVRMVLGQSPRETPLQVNRSTAPACHAKDGLTRRMYLAVYRGFVDLYTRASGKFRNGDRTARFPEHCFPPSLGYTGAVAQTGVS
jgi:REP element-mobilizing transposase RayT